MDAYILLNFILVVGLIFLAMFFSAVETSLLSFPKALLQKRAEENSLLGRAFKEWHEHPSRILTSILIGNNAVTIGATTLVAYLSVHFSEVNHWGLALTGTVSSILITFVIIVFGEALPKIAARSATIRVGTLFVVPIFLFDKLMAPFTWAMSMTFTRFLRKIGSEATLSQVTEEDIKQMIEMGQEEGTIQENEKAMIDSIFKFTDKRVNEVMIPRTEMICVDIALPLEKLVDIIIQNGYSRLPAYKGNVDNIVGIINTRDLLAVWRERSLIVVKDLLHKPYFAPESMRVDRLLREFQRGHIHMAIVVDEFGGTSGLVTLEDLVEEIVGDIRDEYDVEDKPIQKLEDGTWAAEAGVSLDEVNDILGIHLTPKTEVSTLGGYITEKTGRVPKKHRVIQDTEAIFTILEATDKNVTRVNIAKREVPLASTPELEAPAAPKRRKKRIKLPERPVEETPKAAEPKPEKPIETKTENK